MKPELLNSSSLNEQRTYYVYVESLGSKNQNPSKLQTSGKAVEKHNREELKRVKDDHFALKTVLRATPGKRLKTYIDLSGSNIKHLDILMKLDQLNNEESE